MNWYTVKIGNWRMPVKAKYPNGALVQGLRIYKNTNAIPRGAIAKAKRTGGPVLIKCENARITWATVE